MHYFTQAPPHVWKAPAFDQKYKNKHPKNKINTTANKQNIKKQTKINKYK